jgi:signal peptidase I
MHRLLLNSTLIMISSSMSPNLRQNDGVIVGHIPFNSLKIGDIIAFKTYGTDASGNHSTIVHRVAQIVTENGQRIIRAKGDANPDSIPGVDYPIFQRNYIGKVVYIIPQLGAVLGAVNIFANSGGNTAQSSPTVIVPHLMQNLLKVISFFFVACFFVLGFRIQGAERTTTTGSISQSSSPTSPSLIDKYFLLLILSSLIPALIAIIYGIVLIGMYVSGTINTPSGRHAYMEGNYSYLLLLFIFFVPAGAVLFLVKKLHIGTGTSIYNIGTSRYTKEEFLSVAVKVCPKLSEEMAIIIGEEVWKVKGDVHDIISASTIVQKTDGRNEIKEIIRTLKKYGYERT